MKEIEIDGHLILIDDEDYERVASYKWRVAWRGRGLFAYRYVNNKRFMLHRFILRPENNVTIQHISKNTLDNRKSNLKTRNKYSNLKELLEKSSQFNEENGCIEWTRNLAMGYGQLLIKLEKNKYKFTSAHRLSYELHIGKIPQGMFVCHKCDNPKCINPDHLFAGTHKDNMADMRRKGRVTKVKGEQHYQAVLTDKKVLLGKQLRKSGLNYKAIANILGAARNTTERAIKGTTWKHLA